MLDPHPDDDKTAVPPRHRLRDLARLPRAATAIWLGTILATYALGFAAGFLFRLVHFPLPFVLGPMAITACLGFTGLEVQAVRRIRPAAQFVIGAAIGIQFTRAIVLKLVTLLPLILATSVVAIVVCAAAAALMMAITGLDSKTAFFASAPAGASEMANIGLRYGGAPEPIMVSQTMRVVLCVTAAPFLVIHFASHGTLQEVTQAAALPWSALWIVAAAATVGGLVISRTGFPNSWFIGPLIGCAVVGSSGWLEGRMPDPLLIIGQVSIGCSLGAQFRREFLGRLLPQMLSSSVTVLFAVLTMASIGATIAYVLALPVPTMVLALVPAGTAEMTLTGKLLGLDAAIISGFHTVRIIMVMLLCQPAYKLFDRLYGGTPPAAPTE